MLGLSCVCVLTVVNRKPGLELAMNRLTAFLTELTRRRVWLFGGLYLALGWVLLQVAIAVEATLALPEWVDQITLVLLVLGFPVSLLLAWAQENQGMVAQAGTEEAEDSPSRLSIAVLPFVNMSNDPEQEYFSDGISEELLNLLARTQGLKVAARTSSFAFKDQSPDVHDVGRKLDVATVLEGSVRQSGRRLRITAQLIDASTGYHLWSETFDRELTDIFAIQDEISHSIVDALYVHLGVEAPSPRKALETDIEAYRFYLLGRHNFEQRTKETIARARDLFAQAIAIDPDYAPAYSGKADAYLFLQRNIYGDLSLAESIALAEPLIERALELDPDLAEAHASRGLLLSDLEQVEAALQAYDRAIELNPNLARAWQRKAMSLGYTADHLGGLESYQRAHALDPLASVPLLNIVRNKIYFGQFAEADELQERLRAIDGRWANVSNSWVQGMRGNWSAQYTFAQDAFSDLATERNARYVGFAQLALRAFEPQTTGFSEVTRIHINSYNQPAIAWHDYQALPAAKMDYLLLMNIAWAGVREKKHEEVKGLLESWLGFTESFPGPLFALRYHMDITAPFLALARQQSSDEAGAKRLISEIEKYIKVMKEQGATWALPLLEAKVHGLRGEDDQVVAALEQAEHDGYLTWFELDLPFYDAVRDREDFKAIVQSADARVNMERAKLGWEPVE